MKGFIFGKTLDKTKSYLRENNEIPTLISELQLRKLAVFAGELCGCHLKKKKMEEREENPKHQRLR